MIKRIIADVTLNETKIALLEDLTLTEAYIESKNSHTLVGNIYAGRITNVLPGIEAAFVDIGLNVNAFMYIGDKKESLNDNVVQQKKFKIGNELPVQVVKDANGNKGPVVSQYISIPGRLIAIMPGQDYIGISRKITDEQEKERLNHIALTNRPSGYGLILRTNSQATSEEEIIKEIELLKHKADNIINTASYIKAPALLFEELSPIEKVVRDLFSSDIDEFIINDKESYLKVLLEAESLNGNITGITDKIKLYDNEVNIFDQYWITNQLKKVFEKKVWLKSGGYIIIEQTEACVVIDVNTGKNTCKGSMAKTILKSNKEAAIEIAKQIKLRNLSGIIIIDFISMKNEDDKRSIQNILENEVKKDRVKTVVVGMTELGLMQLTRKKIREPLEKSLLK